MECSQFNKPLPLSEGSPVALLPLQLDQTTQSRSSLEKEQAFVKSLSDPDLMRRVSAVPEDEPSSLEFQGAASTRERRRPRSDGDLSDIARGAIQQTQEENLQTQESIADLKRGWRKPSIEELVFEIEVDHFEKRCSDAAEEDEVLNCDDADMDSSRISGTPRRRRISSNNEEEIALENMDGSVRDASPRIPRCKSFPQRKGHENIKLAFDYFQPSINSVVESF